MESQFSAERSKVKVTGRQNLKKCHISSVIHVYLRVAAPAVRRQLRTRPNPLLGLIYCRRLTRSNTGKLNPVIFRHNSAGFSVHYLQLSLRRAAIQYHTNRCSVVASRNCPVRLIYYSQWSPSTFC